MFLRFFMMVFNLIIVDSGPVLSVKTFLLLEQSVICWLKSKVLWTRFCRISTCTLMSTQKKWLVYSHIQASINLCIDLHDITLLLFFTYSSLHNIKLCLYVLDHCFNITNCVCLFTGWPNSDDELIQVWIYLFCLALSG